MDTKKAQEYMSKADMIVQFIKTGEIEDPNLLNDQDTELSDVLSDVLNNYSEEDQTDIFTQILDDEDEEKVEYIEDFIEKNMDAVPFAIARDFAIEGSKRARKRIFIAIAEDEITFDDDPILFYELKDELSPNSSDDDFIEYLHSGALGKGNLDGLVQTEDRRSRLRRGICLGHGNRGRDGQDTNQQ